MAGITRKQQVIPESAEAIRDHAFACLEKGQPNLAAAEILQALEALEALGPDLACQPEAREAKVLLILCSDVPAQRAGKTLYDLFQMRMARQENDLFETFQERLAKLDKVNDPDAGLRLVTYFGNMDHDRVWDAVGNALQQVEQLIGPAFLNSGTLLGVIRERGFLIHDDDVDLGVMLEGNSVQEAATAWIRAYHVLNDHGLLDKEAKRNRAVFKIRALEEMNIDLFPGWVEGGKVHIYPHTDGTLDKADVLPLAVCPTSGLRIPRDPAKFLASNYGEGWRHPDPGYKFRWKRANRKFRRFHDALEADMPAWKLTLAPKS